MVGNSGNYIPGSGGFATTFVFAVGQAADWAAAITAANGGTAPATDTRWFLHEDIQKLWLRNYTNDVIYLSAYKFRMRKDGLDQTNQGPLSSLIDGFYQRLGITYTVVNSSINCQIGITPFYSPTFCRNYKIIKVKMFKLGVGGIRAFKLKTRPKRITNYGEFVSTATSGGQGPFYGTKSDVVGYVFQAHCPGSGVITTPSTVVAGNPRMYEWGIFRTLVANSTINAGKDNISTSFGITTGEADNAITVPRITLGTYNSGTSQSSLNQVSCSHAVF